MAFTLPCKANYTFFAASRLGNIHASKVPAHTDPDFVEKVINHGENSIENVMTCRHMAFSWLGG